MEGDFCMDDFSVALLRLLSHTWGDGWILSLSIPGCGGAWVSQGFCQYRRDDRFVFWVGIIVCVVDEMVFSMEGSLIFCYMRKYFYLMMAGMVITANADMAYAQGGGLNVAMATTVNGVVQGTVEASGVRSFKGVPFAAPPGPVRSLRRKRRPVSGSTCL